MPAGMAPRNISIKHSLFFLYYSVDRISVRSRPHETACIPIAYLFLMVPPPMNVLDSINLPMRHGISVVTDFCLKTAGYGLNRGLFIAFSRRTRNLLGGAGSGFRSLITMISLGSHTYI
jgi:hypothetical protein